MIKIEFLIIDQDNSGRRLDNFIFSKYKKVPKSKIYSSIRKAKIKVNGKKSKPDYVFHLAAQAIVSKSYDDPIETFNSSSASSYSSITWSEEVSIIGSVSSP